MAIGPLFPVWSEIETAREESVTCLYNAQMNSNVPQWTSPRDVDQPWVDAGWVELVITWQDSNVLADCEILGAD